MKTFTLVLSALVLIGLFGAPVRADIVLDNLIWYSEAGNDWDTNTELLADQAPAAPDQSGTGSSRIAYTAASGSNPAYLSPDGTATDGNRSLHPAYALGTNPFSIAVWFRWSELESTTHRYFYDQWNYAGDGEGVLMRMARSQSANALQTIMQDTSSSVGLTGSSLYNDDEWHLVTLVREAATGADKLKLYVDDTMVDSGNPNNIDATSTQDIQLLRAMADSTDIIDINSVFMYSDALTITEVTQNFNEGAGAPIPEPSTLALAVSAGLLLLVRRRSQRNSS